MDPKPQPPVEPAPEECCRSGCNPCVYDLYDEELARYERELAQWEGRHAQQAPTDPQSTEMPDSFESTLALGLAQHRT